MAHHTQLVPEEISGADPRDLPECRSGEHGLSAVVQAEHGLSVVVQAELVSTDTNGVCLKATTGDGRTLIAQVDAAGEGIIRVRLSEDPTARSRASRALTAVHPEGYPEAIVEFDGGMVRVHAGCLTAEILLDQWRLRFLDDRGHVLVSEHPGEVDGDGRVRTLPFGRCAATYHESLATCADERVVGFGAGGPGSSQSIPLYLSSRGYGVLVDSGSPVEFDVCQSTANRVQIVVPDDLLDYYVLAGPDPSGILDRYDRLTCRPTLPPKWAFGTWFSVGSALDTQQGVLSLARVLRERDIPADVLHLDCSWQVIGHWSDLRWDRRRFPDPSGMLATLAALGFRVSLSTSPYLSHRSPLFDTAAARGFLLRRPDGEVRVTDAHDEDAPACGIVDLTHPEAVAWFTGLLRSLLRQGVAALEADLPRAVPADAVAANGMTGVELHTVYALLFTNAVASVTGEATVPAGPTVPGAARRISDHGLVSTRSSHIGAQRCAARSPGASAGSYPEMADTLRGALSHGLSGVPFWSADADGSTLPPADDLYVRWVQFAAMSPLVRFHGTGDRLPWDLPPAVERATVAALRLRYRLLPYLYSAACASAQTGAPLMRALLVDSPDDPHAWTADLEYRIGRDLLVAPMTTPEGTRTVHLPRGEWIDYYSGVVYRGGRDLRVTVPLDRIPLFVRYGALIPMLEQTSSVPDGPFPAVTLVSWGGRTSETVLRDVDGQTSIAAVRFGDRFDVRTAGPGRITSVTFAAVRGTQPPDTIWLNDASVPPITLRVD